jgi:hypothetical protein
MKRVAIALFCLISIGVSLFLSTRLPFVRNIIQSGEESQAISQQTVFEQTQIISKKYLALRHQTDEVLLMAEFYPGYAAWNTAMTKVIADWQALENEVAQLEESAIQLSEADQQQSSLFPQVYAYDKQEISNIFDAAPAGKKIATLAKHLGVDAKMAYKILQQDQAQVEADAWNEAGDTFQNSSPQ